MNYFFDILPPELQNHILMFALFAELTTTKRNTRYINSWMLLKGVPGVQVIEEAFCFQEDESQLPKVVLLNTFMTQACKFMQLTGDKKKKYLRSNGVRGVSRMRVHELNAAYFRI